MSRKLGKPYIVNLLRRSYITKEAAKELHDLIKEEILNEIAKGNAVNLFGVVHLVPYKNKGKIYKGCVDRTLDDRQYRMKAIINRTVKAFFRDRNNENSKHLQRK